jgi:hypothetical protein
MKRLMMMVVVVVVVVEEDVQTFITRGRQKFSVLHDRGGRGGGCTDIH